MNKNYLAGAGIAIAILFSFLAYTKPGQIVVREVQHLGGTSPDFASNYINVGGVNQWWATQSLIQPTTTICSIQGPAATSTLVYASMHMNVATTGGATTIVFSRAAAGATASTSLINGSNLSIGSGAEGNALASSTIFTPNQMLNITQQGGGSFAGGTYSETGSCTAEWIQISN